MSLSLRVAIRSFIHSLPQQTDRVTMDSIIARFEFILGLFATHHIPRVVVCQAIHQSIYFMSANLFNRLIQRRSLCVPHVGFHIKMSLSILEAWLIGGQDVIGSVRYDSLSRWRTRWRTRSLARICSHYLEILTQAANVLMLATNYEFFKTPETIEEHFNRLTLAQVRQLITMYHSDHMVPQRLPERVRQAVAEACNNNPQSAYASVVVPEVLPLDKVVTNPASGSE